MDGNPLVAQAQSQTTGVTGIGILESANDLANGVKDGSWVEAGLGGLGVGLEVLSLVTDPIGTLAQYGVSWLIEHVKPLKDCLDWLAGNPPVIQSFSDTWANVSKEVNAIAGDLANEAKGGTAGWDGSAAEAYRGEVAEQTDALAGAASLCDGISTGVMVMGQVVAAVRETVRDLIGTLVGKLISWALEEACTLGFATPAVAVQATTAITNTINKVSTLIRKLIKTISNVGPKVRKIVEKLGEIIEKLSKLAKRLGKRGEHTSASAARKAEHAADDVHVPKEHTSPSSAHDTPDGKTSPSSSKGGDTSPSKSDGADGSAHSDGHAGGPDGDRAAAPGQSGGSSRPKVDDSVRSYERNEVWANDAYDAIRNSDDVADVAHNLRDAPRLDGSRGFSHEEVETIKNHVFHDRHPLDDGAGGVVHERFEANPDMAEAWLRLRAGRHQEADLALLEHELAENRYWQGNPNAVYWEAHRHANSVSNWESRIPPATNESYDEPWR
ncbi:WXG100 family type VII secretion target [Amycolatopsis sp. NPDC059021]|uniref:WXG100 family type VII secretion target n=1 Tax=Amycolatopsis sp. NPDC059021 TaxID=3346704 RepID=UPI00366B581B